MNPSWRILEGDCRDVLASLPEQSVHTCVTSPPYFGLRDYGTEGQIGLEPTPDEFVAALVAVFREVRRVLRDDGTVWLNLGDSYAAGGNNKPHTGGHGVRGEKGLRDTMMPTRMPPDGCKPKDLLGVPWMVAFALRADGWYLRSDIIWSKPNPMPESVTDRPTKAHEFIFLLSKSAKYHYDADAIREDGSESTVARWGDVRNVNGSGAAPDRNDYAPPNGGTSFGIGTGGRNKRSVWTVATQPYAGAHFACVDAATEALTPAGWRSHDKLTDGATIAAYDQDTGHLGWQPATFHRYDYDGALVAIEKRDLSQRLTPNHRCLVASARGHERVVTADALTPGMRLPVAADWDLPDGLDAEARWGALLGWWITEGHDRPGNVGRIYQSESANPEHVGTIRALLTALDVDFTEHRRKREWRGRPSVEIEFRFRGAALSVLRRFTPGRKLTTATLAGVPDRASRQALLDALIDGDGHRRKDGRACIVQRDRRCIDMMQAFAIELGYRAHITQRADGCHVLYLTRKRWITLRGTNGKHEPIGREHYVGVVWCPSVPSGFWLARRDGKPFITGNTFPPKLIEPCIQAGAPERACSVCGTPWVRVVERGKLVGNDRGGNYKGREADADAAWQNRMPYADGREFRPGMAYENRTLGFEPSCNHDAPTAPGVVLDPFAGAGTTGLVALRHQRSFVGIELNPEYAAMARERIETAVRLGFRSPQNGSVPLDGQEALFA